MILFDLGRKVNRYFKMKKRAEAGKYLSPVRRIERVAPPGKGRYVAMTFDDGPSAAPLNPPVESFTAEKGLTQAILDILAEFCAKGTFDVIGTTEGNYPDRAGKEGTASWGGIRFDHYPDIHKDSLGGIENQLETARRMIREGHELSNHGYRHMIFGPMRFIYGQRAYFDNLSAVVDDLSRLHQLVLEKLNYPMRFSRPPHYIDQICGGYSSYDAYQAMNYQYLAASFDGGGWLPSTGSYAEDVNSMVKPLENALRADPNALNGQIIFHKDGYNMSRQTPVVGALPRHLQLLSDHGYKVVTVSELLSLSPFEDLNDQDPVFRQVLELVKEGRCMGYRNNTFQPDRILTSGELAVMCAPASVVWGGKLNADRTTTTRSFSGVPVKHPYSPAVQWAYEKGLFALDTPSGSFLPDQAVTLKAFSEFLDKAAAGKNVHWQPAQAKEAGMPVSEPDLVRRRDVVDVLYQLSRLDF